MTFRPFIGIHSIPTSLLRKTILTVIILFVLKFLIFSKKMIFLTKKCIIFPPNVFLLKFINYKKMQKKSFQSTLEHLITSNTFSWLRTICIILCRKTILSIRILFWVKNEKKTFFSFFFVTCGFLRIRLRFWILTVLFQFWSGRWSEIWHCCVTFGSLSGK